jgi:hypothetical protein
LPFEKENTLMKKRSTKKAAAILVGIMLLAVSAALAATLFLQGFETDTSGWFDDSNGGLGSITREPSGYTNGGGYANGIASAAGSFHARLSSTDCVDDFGPGTDCEGPFTLWGTNGAGAVFPSGGYVTEVAIYLDVAWASTHPDLRFDWDSAINNSSGGFLSDFVFNAGTTPVGYTGGPGFVIGASPNAFRNSTFPENPCPNPSAPPNTCRTPVLITSSGWYTFRHSFHNDGSGNLAVDLTILNSSANVVTSWTIYQGFLLSNVGGTAYGWFPNEEITDLAIDSSVLRAPQGTAVSMGPQAMEKDLKVKPGDTLRAGYDFTMPGKHPAATVLFTSAMVTFQAQCVSGMGGGTIVVPIPDSSYSDPAKGNQWLPSGDQRSPLVYQGSVTVPNLCGGGQMTLKKGGTFTAQLQSTDTNDKVNIRWHYSADGSDGDWSKTNSFIPGF